MSNEVDRICCDVCGAYLEEDGEKIPFVYDGCCCKCGEDQIDDALLNPDKMGLYHGGSLNKTRFFVLWYRELTFKLGWQHGNKPYEVWRKAHPELGNRFNMCDFHELPNMEQMLTDVWNVPDEDKEED